MALRRDLLVEQALEQQKRIFLAIQAAGPAWLELDLTIGQVKAIFLLAHEGQMTISRLADALGVGRPAASVLADRLVDLGLADRAEDPVDRRRTFVRLSHSAEELMAQLRHSGREWLRECLGRLSDEDLAALVKGLRALAKEVSARDRLAGRPQ